MTSAEPIEPAASDALASAAPKRRRHRNLAQLCCGKARHTYSPTRTFEAVRDQATGYAPAAETPIRTHKLAHTGLKRTRQIALPHTSCEAGLGYTVRL